MPLLLVPALLVAQAAAADLSGLWQSTLRLGPDVRGPLVIYRTPEGWRAELGGFSVPAREARQSFRFVLPDGKGQFREGHWIQVAERFATPVTLVPDGPDRWRSTVMPLENRFTLLMPITRQPDGKLRTYLRNPERNAGVVLRGRAIEVHGDEVRLIGSIGRRPRPDTTIGRGRIADGVINLSIQGTSFDFRRVTDTSSNPFYPRGNPPARYRYTAPLQLADGWPTGTLAEAGIARDSIERYVQSLISMPMDSLSTPQIHSLLVARHGKLVLEEYFHGYHRDEPHDLRSASKSSVAVLIGAAMQAGIPIRLDSPVYETMGVTTADVRKRSMTLEHLLTMTAGFNCDPDDSTSADEDVMDNRGVTDWFAHTLNVELVSAPGEKIFYCSTEPHLAGGMLAKVAKQSQLELFQRLIARPLQLRNYYLGLRNGEVYGGGGHRFTPREFMKLVQLMMNDGRWNGKQVLSRDWVRRSSAPLRDLGTTQQYGFLWNSREYDYKGRKIRGFYAAGNGGQIFMGFPDLGLVVAYTGGNYNDRPITRVIESILAAVRTADETR